MLNPYERNDQPKCPYCDHEHEEWWEFCTNIDDDEYKITCDSCGRDFDCHQSIEFYFTTQGDECKVHQLVPEKDHDFIEALGFKPNYLCRVCKREFWGQLLADGSHREFTEDQYVIVKDE